MWYFDQLSGKSFSFGCVHLSDVQILKHYAKVKMTNIRESNYKIQVIDTCTC
jgi:hypothetical protein